MQRMLDSNPLLSICIPTYNRRQYLQECLDSIITQDEFNIQEIEIVISDNASTDDTTILVQEYTGKYPNIIYHRNTENIGADRNVIKVLWYWSGRFLWLLSDDDIILPWRFRFVVHELRKYRNVWDIGFFQVNFTVLGATINSYEIVNFLWNFPQVNYYDDIHTLYKSYRYRHNGLSYLSIDIFSNEIQSFDLNSIPITNFPHSCIMGLISDKKAIFIWEAVVWFRQHNATGNFASPIYFFKIFVIDFFRYMIYLYRIRSKISQFRLSILGIKMIVYSVYLGVKYFFKKIHSLVKICK